MSERSERSLGTVRSGAERPVTEFRRWAAPFYPEYAAPVGA